MGFDLWQTIDAGIQNLGGNIMPMVTGLNVGKKPATDSNPGNQPPATPMGPGLGSPFDFSKLLGQQGGGGGFGQGGGGAFGQANSMEHYSTIFSGWDQWRRQMLSQNYYLPALQVQPRGY